MNRKERRAAAKHGKLTPIAGDTGPPPEDLLAEARRYYQQGLLTQAKELCNRILARAEQHVPALNLLGVIAQATGRHKLAVKILTRAIASDALNAACHYNIATSYLALDQRERAAHHFTSAIALGMSEKNIEDFILQNPVIASCVERIETKWPLPVKTETLFGPTEVETIANDVFLRCALESVVIRGIGLEMFLTHLRAALLQFAHEHVSQPETSVLALLCTVARQCFINEYIYVQTDEETQRARRLLDLLLQKIANGAAIPPLLVAATAAYRPLHTIAEARALLGRDWPSAMAELLRQQIREPLEEAQDHDAIPALTAIEDATSLRVMQQYEENPYPRWSMNPITTPISEREPASAGEDILIAGCGSGQHALQVAQWFPSARVLAVDVSRPSLAYARRKTREQKLRNIDYAQADILKLDTLDRSFDRIEAVGVLHHLTEPETGWRVLLNLLRPGGIMRIGLYSEHARRSIMEARGLIAERGYRATAEDIRRCRQEVLREADKRDWAPLIATADFYSMSGCRDLLFNVMEHRFTIPRIKAFLDAHRLTFLGFELEPDVVGQFQKRFPSAGALTSLDDWHAFEADNPLTFRYMYLFTARKT